MVCSSCSGGIAAVDRAIEGGRERSKEVATRIRPTAATAEITTRIMERLHFPAMNVCRGNRGKVHRRDIAALGSRARLGECHRDRFLHDILKDDRGAVGNSGGYKTGGDEGTHRVSPHLCAFLARSGTDGFAPADKRPCSSRKGKGLRFDLDENSPKQANRSVKAGRFGTFEIDEEALDPR
jgi:hypothetical protein